MNRPLYFQLPSANPEALANFYASCFGWSIAPLENFSDIWVLVTGPNDSPGLQGIIMGKYMDCTVNVIAVENLDHSLAAVQSHGGGITTPKHFIENMGFFAWCTDNDANQFVLMQPTPNAGEYLYHLVSHRIPAPETERPVHFEIPASDAAAVQQFYSAVLGWTFQIWEGPFPYVFAMTGDSPAGGINGAITAKAMSPKPCNVIQTLDVDDAVRRVTSRGASVMMPPQEIPGVGRFAYILDPDGNQVGLMQFIAP